MKNLSKNVVIAYWAGSQLSFVQFTRRLCKERGLNFIFIQISHEESWFTDRKSILLNFFHLSKIFLKILCIGLRGRVVSFGTNTCRVLVFFSWLFRDIHYVYNELPSISFYSPLTWLDWFIFRFAKNVAVSSVERADLISRVYKLSRPIYILENITLTDIPEMNLLGREGDVLFSGSITPKRFFDGDLSKLTTIVNRIAKPIDVYGEIAVDISSKFIPLLNFKGKVNHSKMMEIMKSYKYGLLSYYTNELNYDYCAPLKLYEYVANGCVVISLNTNKGLVMLAKRYPALITFAPSAANDMLLVSEKLLDYEVQRQSFLLNAIISNRKFADCVVG